MEPTREPWDISEVSPENEAGPDDLVIRIRFSDQECTRRAQSTYMDQRKEDQANIRLLRRSRELMDIASRLESWELDPDRYSGDLADLAHEARSILTYIREGRDPI